jgi:site-specific recombinase XerD
MPGANSEPILSISTSRYPRIAPAPAQKPKLLERLSEALRSRHYSRRTEQSYTHWVRRFVFFHNKRHPVEMGELEINAYLTHLAVKEKVSASTQNQALSALLFPYRHVLDREIGDLGEGIRARKPRHIPVVMTREEVKTVLANLAGDKWLMASLMYGAGLRLMECLRLRVQDIDFACNEILVRDGKGAKDRITMLPQSLKVGLRDHLRRVKALHEQDLARRLGTSSNAHGLGPQISQRPERLAVAMGFSAGETVDELQDKGAGPPSCGRVIGSKSREKCRRQGGFDQTRYLPHFPALVRHSSIGSRLRYPDCPGTPGP